MLIKVSIPSQRRYVGYWASILTIPRGIQTGCMDVKLPKSVSRQLLRIRLYDTVNINSVFFVASELHEVCSKPMRFLDLSVRFSNEIGIFVIDSGSDVSPTCEYLERPLQANKGNKPEY